MRNIRQIAKYLIVSITVLMSATIHASAQQRVDPAELSLSENLSTPEIGKKAVAPIERHFSALYDKLKGHYSAVAMVRDGMGICVTIPCSELFAPNSSELKSSGHKYLRPFVAVAQKPTMYKVLVAVFSDDTGEDEYRDALTADRAIAIDQYLTELAGQECPSVIPYGMGSDDPIADNATVAHRDANRRVEIYILPEWQMVDNARSGHLR